MAVPKQKTSKSRRNKRRTHQKLTAPTLTTCAQCGEAKLPHHVCPACGTYRGRTFLETEE
ncbi:MAG: 50S ribosomal protein L32 [Desulfobacterales bacterium]